MCWKVYYYKYKDKKDDLNWRIAVVGLVPEKDEEFEFEDRNKMKLPLFYSEVFGTNRYSFTSFTETKYNEEQELMPQLLKLQKRLLYSKRKSASKFDQEVQE